MLSHTTRRCSHHPPRSSVCLFPRPSRRRTCNVLGPFKEWRGQVPRRSLTSPLPPTQQHLNSIALIHLTVSSRIPDRRNQSRRVRRTVNIFRRCLHRRLSIRRQKLHPCRRLLQVKMRGHAGFPFTLPHQATRECQVPPRPRARLRRSPSSPRESRLLTT